MLNYQRVRFNRFNHRWEAIQKRAASPRFAPGRATPAMCLSDGYDSGAIAVSLGRLGIEPAMYTVQAREVTQHRPEASRITMNHHESPWITMNHPF